MRERAVLCCLEEIAELLENYKEPKTVDGVHWFLIIMEILSFIKIKYSSVQSHCHSVSFHQHVTSDLEKLLSVLAQTIYIPARSGSEN
jgi:hypothetical protein